LPALLVEVSKDQEQQQGHDPRQDHHISGKAVHGAQSRSGGWLTARTLRNFGNSIVSQPSQQTQYDFSTRGVES
jgi:hypothetical protein